MKPSLVLRLITRLNVGGPARQALLLTEALSDSYPTTLAAGRPQANEAELPAGGVPITRVPLSRPVDPINDVRALRSVKRLISSTGCRLVHTHMAKAGFVGRVAGFTSKARPITVHTFHGHVLEGYFSHGTERIFIAIERALARRTDALVAVSPEVRDSLLALGVGTAERFHVIPLGFDLSKLLELRAGHGELRSFLGVDDKVPLVAVLGRLTLIKDHLTLLKAIALLPKAHLAVLGDGELRGELMRTARSLGIEKRVHFTGWWLDIPSALADVDVVALTSRNEGTPVSLIEASAAALPVVGTRVGGVTSVVKDGFSGFLAEARDHEAIAARLGRLISDQDLRRTMGAAGREFVRERFSKDRLVADIKALYDELLAHRARR